MFSLHLARANHAHHDTVTHLTLHSHDVKIQLRSTLLQAYLKKSFTDVWRLLFLGTLSMVIAVNHYEGWVDISA